MYSELQAAMQRVPEKASDLSFYDRVALIVDEGPSAAVKFFENQFEVEKLEAPPVITNVVV